MFFYIRFLWDRLFCLPFNYVRFFFVKKKDDEIIMRKGPDSFHIDRTSSSSVVEGSVLEPKPVKPKSKAKYRRKSKSKSVRKSKK